MKKLFAGILLGIFFTGVVLGFYFNRETRHEGGISQSKKTEEMVYPDLENSLPVKEENVPDELQAVLLADIKKDSEWMSRCGGQESFSIEDYKFKSESIDLNDDGIKEFIISPWNICNFVSRGASGNGFIFIFQKTNGVWEKIGTIEGNAYAVKEEQTTGYHDIVTHWHTSAASGSFTLYRWQKDWRGLVAPEYLPVLKRFYWNQDDRNSS